LENKKNEKFIVIDGQQRLKSIYFFIDGKFKENQKDRPFN